MREILHSMVSGVAPCECRGWVSLSLSADLENEDEAKQLPYILPQREGEFGNAGTATIECHKALKLAVDPAQGHFY